MRNPCDTCAFKNDSVTHGEPYNRFRGQVLAMAGLPFFCHHSHDYKRPFIVVAGLAVQEGQENGPQRLQVCEGWRKEILNNNIRPGIAFHNERLRRRELGAEVLQTLEAALKESEPEKSELWKVLGDRFARLVGEAGFEFVEEVKI